MCLKLKRSEFAMTCLFSSGISNCQTRVPSLDSFTSEEIQDTIVGYVKIIMFRVVVELVQVPMGVGRSGGLCSYRVATKGGAHLSSDSYFLVPELRCLLIPDSRETGL